MQDHVTELDLAVVNALQERPRATWTQLGRVLEVDPVTVARRWERLTGGGLARVTGFAATGLTAARLAYVEIDVRADAVGAVADELGRHRATYSIHHMTGARSLLVGVGAETGVALSRYLVETLGGVAGILAVRAQLVIAHYRDGSAWRLQALDPAQRQALAMPGMAPQGSQTGPLHADDLRLIDVLAGDGRQSLLLLAEQTELSEATVRRRLDRLLATRRLVLRCDLAQAVSGWPVTVVLWAWAPVAELRKVGEGLSRIREVRATVAISGSNNLMLFAWLRDIADLPGLERLVLDQFPQVRIGEVAVALRTEKLMGWRLDRHGRFTTFVPIEALSENPPRSTG